MKQRAKAGESFALGTSWAAHETDDCVLWPFALGGNGYGVFYPHGPKQKVYVHRYVCEQKHGAPPTPAHQAAHLCGRANCFNWRHLTWKTVAENHADKLIHGTHSRGEQHGASKLTRADVAAIRGSKQSQRKTADQFGVSQSYVSELQLRKKWGWLT